MPGAAPVSIASTMIARSALGEVRQQQQAGGAALDQLDIRPVPAALREAPDGVDAQAVIGADDVADAQ